MNKDYVVVFWVSMYPDDGIEEIVGHLTKDEAEEMVRERRHGEHPEAVKVTIYD